MTQTEISPYDHDMRWLELSREAAKAERKVDSEKWNLLHATDFRKDYNRDVYRLRGRGDSFTVSEALAHAIGELVLKTERLLSYSATGVQLVAKYNEAVLARTEAQLALEDHEAGYTGWQRFFLVTSSNGLIHRSMNCSTCNKGRKWTEFALLPTLSGLAIDNAVEVLGPSLCSVCFPEAPVAVVDGPKLPKSVTEVLFAKGPEAFLAALTEYRTKQAAKAAKKVAL